jgi:hypothetical protein
MQLSSLRGSVRNADLPASVQSAYLHGVYETLCLFLSESIWLDSCAYIKGVLEMQAYLFVSSLLHCIVRTVAG